MKYESIFEVWVEIRVESSAIRVWGLGFAMVAIWIMDGRNTRTL